MPTSLEQPGGVGFCIVCGERGVADAILNAVLFAPLGAALGLGGWGPRRSLLVAAFASSLIELAQLVVITGRDPSVGDVLFDTAGAGLGWVIFHRARGWLWPDPVVARRRAVRASLALAVGLAVTAQLYQPAYPTSTYFGQWTASLPNMERYRGRVLAARLGAAELRSGFLEDSDGMRHALRAAVPLVVRLVAGPAPAGPAPVVSIVDDVRREVILLGADGEDILFRYRTRSNAMRFDRPDLRVPDALASVQTGDTLTIGVRRHGREWCVAVDEREACGLGYTLGSGWGLFFYAPFLAPLDQVLAAIWVAALFFPLGLWWRRHWVSGLAAAIGLATLIAGPMLFGLRDSPSAELVGAAVGLVSGLTIARHREPQRLPRPH